MRNEIYDRDDQAGRAERHAGADHATLRIGRFIGEIFEAIHAIHFAAPWRQQQRGGGGRPGTA